MNNLFHFFHHLKIIERNIEMKISSTMLPKKNLSFKTGFFTKLHKFKNLLRT